MDNKITFIFININSFKSLGYDWLTTSLSCLSCRNMIYLLQIGFGQSVRQWYSGIVDSEVTLCDSRSNSDDGNMSIYIHNYSTPMDCCMHPLCIFCCFPFWLLCGGPCYFVSTLSLSHLLATQSFCTHTWCPGGHSVKTVDSEIVV